MLVIVIVGFKLGSRALQKRKMRSLMQKNCGGTTNSDTILVVMSNDRDATCGTTIDSLYNQAFCPFRVSVGVVETIRPGEPSCAAQYAKLAKRAPRSFVDQVRCLRRKAKAAHGPAYDRRTVLKRLYQGEKYLWFLHSGALPTQHWDKLLLSDGNVVGPGNVWITCPLRNSSVRDPLVPGRACALQFDIRTNLVELRRASIATAPKVPLSTPYWISTNAFGRAEHILKSAYTPSMDAAWIGEDAYMSDVLQHKGASFFIPTVAPATIQAKYVKTTPDPTFIQSSVAKASHQMMAQTLRSMAKEEESTFARQAGIEYDTNTISVHGLMGLRPHESADTIERMFGSRYAYERARDALIS